MNKDYKKCVSQLVNITVNYLNFGFIAHYYNCIVLKIETLKNDEDFLFVLTDNGETKIFSLYDQKNIKVDICPT